MKLTFSIIGIALAIICSVNIACQTAAWYYVIIASLWCVVLQFAIDGLFAFLINKLPDKWFGVNNRLFHVTKAERKLYKKLRIRRWKDKLWELGGLGGFSKKTIANPDSPEYLEKFIIESHRGVAVHRVGYVMGFLAMLTLPNVCALTIALPVAVVNVFINSLSTMALRYNTPTLKAMYEKKLRTQNKEKVA
jgi:glycosyl-4,4'-diaponeurosporenoate acyltransferase